MTVGRYPIGTRCRIISRRDDTIDLGGESVTLKDPGGSVQHIGKFGFVSGYASVVDENNQEMNITWEDNDGTLVTEAFVIPVLTLDDGTTLLGAQCHWEVVPTDPLTTLQDYGKL